MQLLAEYIVLFIHYKMLGNLEKSIPFHVSAKFRLPFFEEQYNPADIYFFKGNNRNTRKRCKIC